MRTTKKMKERMGKDMKIKHKEGKRGLKLPDHWTMETTGDDDDDEK